MVGCDGIGELFRFRKVIGLSVQLTPTMTRSLSFALGADGAARMFWEMSEIVLGRNVLLRAVTGRVFRCRWFLLRCRLHVFLSLSRNRLQVVADRVLRTVTGYIRGGGTWTCFC